MNDDRPPLTREDFLDEELWLQHCHQGGLQHWDVRDEDAPYSPASGSGSRAALSRAIDGPDDQAFRRSREGYTGSTHLELADFIRGYQAVAFANCRGRVMDVHVSIAWSTVGITDASEVQSCMRRFLAIVDGWYADRGRWPSVLWVLERGERRGVHSHLLLGAPADLRFPLASFLHEAVARTVAPTPLLQTEGSSTVVVRMEESQSIRVQWVKFRYLFKGVDPTAGWLVQGEDRPEWRSLAVIAGLELSDEGEVELPRMGVSGGLDTAAILLWRDLAALPSLDPQRAQGPWDLYGYDTQADFLAWGEAHHLEVQAAEQALRARPAGGSPAL